VLSVFTAVFLIGLVSAASLAISNDVIPASITHDQGSFQITFDVTNTGTADTNVSFAGSTVTIGTGTVTGTDFAIADGTVTPVVVSTSATVTFDAYQSGSIAGSVIIDDSGTGTPKTLTFSVPINASSSISVSDATISGTSSTVTVKNTGNTALTNIAVSVAGDFDATVDPTTIASLAAGASQDVTVNVTETDDMLGTQTVTVTATSSEGPSDTGTVTSVGEFCEYGNYGDDGELGVKLSINNKAGFGDDDEWYLLDEIEVEIEVKNEGKEDVDNIEVSWGLFNTETGEWYVDEEESDFNLKDGKEKTLTVTLNLDEDLEDLESGTFILIAKATGEVDGGTQDGKNICASESETDITIKTDSVVILSDIKFPETSQCGDELLVTAKAWNIGDDQQDDVSMVIYNKDLGINQNVEIGDVDAFDSEKISVTVTLPENVEEKFYTLEFIVYDEDNDVFETDDNDETKFTLPLKLEGNCKVDKKAVVSATLESGGQAGKELVVKATIVNTGDEPATYTLNLADYADWAESASLDQSVVLLGSGESKEVIVTLNVKSDASGDKTFELEVTSDNELVTKQPVSVTIEEKGASPFSGITGKVIGEGSWYIWGIGFLNVILIIIIIVVALRISRS